MERRACALPAFALLFCKKHKNRREACDVARSARSVSIPAQHSALTLLSSEVNNSALKEGAFNCTVDITMRKRFRHVYRYPTRDVAGGIQVGIATMPADLTPELRLGFSVGFGDMPTFRAGSACVARVNCFDHQSSAFCLVLYKIAKLAETPIVQSFLLLFVGLNPAADMRQIFERNTHAVAFSSGNDGFRDAMVLMFLESLLLAAHVAKVALCRTRTNTLQLCASLCISDPVSFHSRPGVLIADAIRRDVDDPHINAKHPIRRKQARIIEVAYSTDVPLAAHEHKINFALAMCKQFSLMLSTDKGNLGSTWKEPNRDHIAANKPKYAVIVGLSGILAKCARLLLVNLVRISNFRDAAHGNLSGQIEASAKLGIKRLVHVVLAEYALLKCGLRKPAACFVTTLKRIFQSGFLLWRGCKFEVGDKLHASSIEKNKIAYHTGGAKKGAAYAAALSLSGMNAKVSRAIG